MTAVRLLKCYGYCNEKHPKEEMIKVGGANHCKPCAVRKEKDKKDREILYKTIQSIYKIPYPSGMMLRQIKQFSEDRDYTLEGMTMTLCYFVKVIRKTPFANGGLSFLPYYYDSAVKYYADQEERRKNSTDVDTKVVKMQITRPKQSTESFKTRKIVSMEESLLYDN